MIVQGASVVRRQDNIGQAVRAFLCNEANEVNYMNEAISEIKGGWTGRCFPPVDSREVRRVKSSEDYVQRWNMEGRGPGADSPSSTESNRREVINERPSGSWGWAGGWGAELWETLVLTDSALPSTLTLIHTHQHTSFKEKDNATVQVVDSAEKNECLECSSREHAVVHHYEAWYVEKRG